MVCTLNIFFFYLNVLFVKATEGKNQKKTGNLQTRNKRERECPRFRTLRVGGDNFLIFLIPNYLQIKLRKPMINKSRLKPNLVLRIKLRGWSIYMISKASRCCRVKVHLSVWNQVNALSWIKLCSKKRRKMWLHHKAW